MSNTHDQPWAQFILYECNLNSGEEQFYEYEEWGDDLWTFRFASRKERMNCLVQFDADGVTPPP